MRDRIEKFLSEGRASGYREIDLELVRYLLGRHPDLPAVVWRTAALLSRTYREGDVCLELERWAGDRFLAEEAGGEAYRIPGLEEWKEALRESPVVGSPGEFCPLILDPGDRLYLHRLHTQEASLAGVILQRCGRRVEEVDQSLLDEGLRRLFPDFTGKGIDWQRVGAALGILNYFTVISGGPGTGKTATVVRLMALLLEQSAARGEELQIALAAPTGKAAARLKESVRGARETLNCPEEIRERLPSEAVTLHRLLGARRHSATFVYNRDHPLPADVVIVDEASMVDQTLMYRLTEALEPGTRLILLGDRDQLASVEAGSVLGDVCGGGENPRFSGSMRSLLKECGLELPKEGEGGEEVSMTDQIVLLRHNFRFSPHSGIAAFSEQVNAGNAEKALEILESREFPDIGIRDFGDTDEYRRGLGRRASVYLDRALESGEPATVFQAYRRTRLLSPHRRGPLGTVQLNRTIEYQLSLQGRISRYDTFYAGKPVMITRNDHLLNLHNGDIGICLPNERGDLRVWFQKEGEIRDYSPSRLPSWETAYAITVHKSQGSEFDEIVLLLPRQASPVLSRELVYTAVTRARKNFRVLGTPDILRQAIGRSIRRSSGLKERLWSA